MCYLFLIILYSMAEHFFSCKKRKKMMWTYAPHPASEVAAVPVAAWDCPLLPGRQRTARDLYPSSAVFRQLCNKKKSFHEDADPFRTPFERVPGSREPSASPGRGQKAAGPRRARPRSFGRIAGNAQEGERAWCNRAAGQGACSGRALRPGREAVSPPPCLGQAPTRNRCLSPRNGCLSLFNQNQSW